MATPTKTIPGLALLVLDVQDIFLRAMACGDAVRKSCRFAVQAAKLLGIPVVYTEQTPSKLGPTTPDVLGAAGDDPVIFPKDSFSSFGADGFSEWLEEHEITHLLICGIETSICIYQTALQAIDSDMEVTLLTDALGARRSQDHEAALQALARKTECHLLPSETVFYSILGTSKHPCFKTFNSLVRDRDK
ncbi:MAG: isochorismatase family protein [Puniceicoccales bacterium]|jgi:nicotinamidase-related amidase|nr:isochorismatase family protein [Puniceicoccales bacterium]